MKKEIECLDRLQSLVMGLDDIFGYLIEEQILTLDEVKAIRSESMASTVFYNKIKELRASNGNPRNNIQLMEYRWELLPVERITITIVTDRTSKEFTYNV